MPVGGAFVRLLGALAVGMIGATGAAAQEETRNDCLEFDQVEAIHRLGESDMLLEVDGGLTLYHITVEARCFHGDANTDITITGSGRDSCMRTTDRVHYGRRECGIEGFELIETQDQLDALLHNRFE